MKILNLYAGIGGNRKLWGDDHDITAVEYNQQIADIYKDFFPNDKVIVADAHEYLLNHYKEFDFIWSSPPCPTHSDMRKVFVKAGRYDVKYPDMALYQQIILLKHYCKSKWVIENVVPYYDYLIDPNVILHRHPFWCNFPIKANLFNDKRKHRQIKSNSVVYGVSLEKYKITGKYDKVKILRNMVNPEVGKYILNEAMGIIEYDKNDLFKGIL